MATQELGANHIAFGTKSELSGLEKYALTRAHPARIFVNGAGWIWVIYFLWNQNLPGVIISIFATWLIGFLLIKSVNFQEISKTTLGKIALLHLHPFNFAIQIISMVPLFYGIWTHNTVWLLAGLSLLLFGHAFGWEKMNPGFEERKPT